MQKSIKIMLDTNIYDKLEQDSETNNIWQRLIDLQKIHLLQTHIQEDELAEGKKENIKTSDKLPTEGFVLGISRLGEAKLGDGSKEVSTKPNSEKIPTAGAVWGVSRWGEACWGDGSQSGISIDDIKTEAGNHLEDALIATTASLNADILVTEDKRLYKKLKSLSTGCKIFTWEEFKHFLKQIP